MTLTKGKKPKSIQKIDSVNFLTSLHPGGWKNIPPYSQLNSTDSFGLSLVLWPDRKPCINILQMKNIALSF